MSAEALKNDFLPKYLLVGDEGFYRFLLSYAMLKLTSIHKGEYKGIKPDIEFLDYYDKFIILYRREGEQNYLNMARLFRKAAHKIYRVMLKKDMTNRNAKFLNVM